MPNTQPWMVTGNEDIFPTAPFSKELMLQANLPHNHPVWRRSLHDKFGYFEEEKYKSGSDWDFWLRCTVGGSKMELIPQKLGIYYQNPDLKISISKTRAKKFSNFSSDFQLSREQKLIILEIMNSSNDDSGDSLSRRSDRKIFLSFFLKSY